MVKDLLSALWRGNWQRKEDAKGNFKLNTKGFPDSGCLALSSRLAGKQDFNVSNSESPTVGNIKVSSAEEKS